MKLAIAAFLLVAASAHAEDSDLVKAARASGGPKKKSTTKVITNADVKKSTGKLIELPPKKEIAAPAPVQQSEIAAAEEAKKVRAVKAKQVGDLQAKVQKLEKELASIEQSYYESNDPVARDNDIARKFAETKSQLAQARKELAAAKQ